MRLQMTKHFALVFLVCFLSIAVHSYGSDQTNVGSANKISRTMKAVNYRHRGGATRIDFRGTDLMPQATGEAKVESKTGRVEIDAKFDGLGDATKFGLEYLTYVFWGITPQGRAVNLGELLLDHGRARLRTTTDLQTFGMIVTAEPYFAVTQPGDVVVMENFPRPDTVGREEQIDTKFDLLQRGMYSSSNAPIRDAIYGIDRTTPLELFEARNAVRRRSVERASSSQIAFSSDLACSPANCSTCS